MAGMLSQGAAAAGAGGPAPVAPTVPELAQSAAAAGAPGPQPAGAAPSQSAPAAVPGGPAPTPGGGVDTSTGGRATGDFDIAMEDATPEEQKEYERAMTALARVLYENEKASNAIVDQIDPDDKVGSTAKVSMLFMKTLDEKIDLDEIVVAQMVEETTSRIMELAETRHSITYDEREAQMIVGSTWEGVQTMFGIDEQSHAEMVQGVGSDLLPQLKAQHEAALNG